MVSVATRRTENTQESRRLLIAAAADLFAEKGYRQTSFIDIGERAGVSRGSIPWHFGNKLGLLKAVIEAHLEYAEAAFDEPGGEPLAAVVSFIRMPTTRLFIALLSEAVESDSPLREYYARLQGELRRAVRDRLPPAALPRGADPDALAALLVGAVIGVHAQWRVAPGAVDLDAIGETIRALFPALAGPRG